MFWYFLIGYAAGSTPFAYLNSRLKGGNIFREGSGNPGATNTLILYGKLEAFKILLLDVLKGYVPTALVGTYTGDFTLAFWTGAGAVVGHAFSFYTKFNGGKALASAGGAMLYLYPLPLVVVIATYVLLAFLIRYIVVATTIPVLGALGYFLWLDQPLGAKLALLTMVAAVLYRHLPNWERMYLKNEPKIGDLVHEVTLERLPKDQQLMLRVIYWAVVLVIVVLLLVL
jgi:glycerol-3-phosphate acyltransferase PlsY